MKKKEIELEKRMNKATSFRTSHGEDFKFKHLILFYNYDKRYKTESVKKLNKKYNKLSKSSKKGPIYIFVIYSLRGLKDKLSEEVLSKDSEKFLLFREEFPLDAPLEKTGFWGKLKEHIIK